MISTETKRIPQYILPNIRYRGFASNFGGPLDDGVEANEGVALYNQDEADCRPELFLPRFVTVEGVEVNLARRLIPDALYCACRWDYGATPKDLLRTSRVFVQRVDNHNQSAYVSPADWGPNERLNRIIDLSPGVFKAMGLVEDETEVFITLEIPSWRWSEMQPKRDG